MHRPDFSLVEDRQQLFHRLRNQPEPEEKLESEPVLRRAGNWKLQILPGLQLRRHQER